MGISLSSFCHWLLFLFILCPLYAGCLTAAELVHFSKALGHSWTIFAQKIGYEAEELKVAGSTKLSKKAFFAKIWLVPKFDNDQVKNLLCELLTAIQLGDVLHNFWIRLSQAESSRHGISALETSTSTFTMSLLDAPEGSRSESDVASTDTETETETETPSESEGERAKKDVSATVVGQNCDSLSAKAASQSDSGLVSPPSSGSAAWSMVTSLSASSVPPPWEEPEDSTETLLDPGDLYSSAKSGFDQGFPDAYRMSFLDATEVFSSVSDMASTNHEAKTETETSESEGERTKKNISPTVVGQNCDSLGTKVASQFDSGWFLHLILLITCSTFMQSSLLYHMMLSVISRRPVMHIFCTVFWCYVCLLL